MMVLGAAWFDPVGTMFKATMAMKNVIGLTLRGRLPAQCAI